MAWAMASPAVPDSQVGSDDEAAAGWHASSAALASGLEVTEWPNWPDGSLALADAPGRAPAPVRPPGDVPGEVPPVTQALAPDGAPAITPPTDAGPTDP